MELLSTLVLRRNSKRCQFFDMKARFRRIVELIQGHGLEQVREPHVKHLEGPLWEMRMKGRDGISRDYLYNGDWPPGCCRSGLREENAKNAENARSISRWKEPGR